MARGLTGTLTQGASANTAPSATLLGGPLEKSTQQAKRKASETARSFFRKRSLFIVIIALVLVTINVVSGSYLGFDVIETLVEMPAGIVWMVTHFFPTVEALEKLPTILSNLLSTVLVSIAASCIAGVLAFIFAVLGSRSVGLKGPLPLVVRGIASLFRNIPTVAWALVLIFSFRQSEFTGFMALFLTSFGYLTRCFLESIDEVSGEAVEALRATGASYGQLIVQAVVPLSATAVISWVLYMIETNVRDATLVGMLTGTGIGFLFDMYYKRFAYDQATLIIIAIVIVVIALEMTSNFIRRVIL